AAEAEAAFKQAVDVDPKSVVALLALANFYWSAGRMGEVEAPLLKSIQLEPSNTLAQRALAMFYLSTGRGPEAEAPLKVLAGRQGDTQSQLMLGDYYVMANRIDDGVKVLEALAKEPAGYAEGTLRLAAIDYMQNRVPEAHRKVDEVRQKQPKNAQAVLL